MAVVDISSLDGTAVKAYKIAGTDQIELICKATITNGDSAGSIYRLAQIPANYIPVWGEINTAAAITGVTDADLGFYLDDEKGGAVKDVNALVDAADLDAAALAIGSGVDALRNLGVANLQKTIAELLSDGAAEYNVYTLALTINQASTATGDVYLRIRFACGA